MGERKVLNFYVPPDFDASIIPRQKRDKTKMIEVRTMLPFSMRCNTCGEYMYRGKKFTAKKEMIQGEEYMRIRKFRFHIHCSVCSAVIVFKTDPKNSDYEMESGGSRNFEVWRDDTAAVEQMEKEREEEDTIDAMKALENRTMDNKVEMDVLDALDEIQVDPTTLPMTTPFLSPYIYTLLLLLCLIPSPHYPSCDYALFVHLYLPIALAPM